MDTEVRAIQLKCLEILRVVDRICRQNNIKYSLNGGSVVGAYLYEGCLPWDDDIDILMTRENYNRFVSIAPELLPSGYVLENYQLSENFTVGCSKVIDENTTLVEKDGNISGIFIDITVFDRVPDSRIKVVDILCWKIGENVLIGPTDATSFYNRLRNLALKTILRNRRSYFFFFQKIVQLLSHCTPYHYSELFGGGNAQTREYAPHIFENYIEIRFEDEQFMIMRDYIDYLTTRYNRSDFREPKEKQVAPHYAYVNFELPYKDYIHLLR